jgi:hypothetical protein
MIWYRSVHVACYAVGETGLEELFWEIEGRTASTIHVDGADP